MKVMFTLTSYILFCFGTKNKYEEVAFVEWASIWFLPAKALSLPFSIILT